MSPFRAQISESAVPKRFLFNKPSDNSQWFHEKLFQITRGFFLDQRIFSKKQQNYWNSGDFGAKITREV